MSKKQANPQPSNLIKSLMTNADIVGDDIKQDWKEVEDLYQSIGLAIIGIGTQINTTINFINNIASESTVDMKSDVDEITQAVAGIKRDIDSFTNDLVSIHERHTHRTGKVDAGEDMMLCMSVFNDYVILNDRFRSLTFPPMLTITENMMNISSKFKKEQAEKQIQDVNVVTDVEVKEKVEG